jgi:hypothetical protein
MIKINESFVKVNTPNGIGVIEDILVTSLGYIQLRVKFESDEDDCATYMKYNVATFDKLLENTQLNLVELLSIVENNA